MLKLYVGNMNYSSWSMRPWVLLKQAGIAFETVMVRFDSFEPESQFKRTLGGITPAGRVPVLVDGGIRRGTDVLKALALGATATLIGRAYLYGLAVNGADGVSHILQILRRELEMAMALTGRTSIKEIDASVIWR
jgi:hypothetical protein